MKKGFKLYDNTVYGVEVSESQPALRRIRRNNMESIYKEVYFGEYCCKCKYEKLDEAVDPCHECLENPVNLYSHKPINFEEE